MSRDLRQGLSAPEVTTNAALAVLALASGVYTYIGVRGLLSGDSLLMSGAAVVYSAAVSVAIYVFWVYALRFMPLIRGAGARISMFFVMALGCCAIVAMSSWLNAAALAGSAAMEQHLAGTVEEHQHALERAHENALAAQSLLPDVQLASRRFRELSRAEAEGGTLTGTAGVGTVVQLLSQMADQLDGLADEIVASRAEVAVLFAEGRGHLGVMREMVAGAGAIEPRSLAFAEEAVGLAGVITALQETSIAPALRRAASDLSSGFIAPAPDGRTAGLVAAQQAVVGSVEQSIASVSAGLAAAADQILSRPRVDPPRFTPLSRPEAVLRYAGDFVPSWAGAIAIDLLPAVLVLMLMVVHGVIRQMEGGLEQSDRMTVTELAHALSALQRIEGVRFPATAAPAAPAAEPPREAEPLPAAAEAPPEPRRADDATQAPGPHVAGLQADVTPLTSVTGGGRRGPAGTA